MRLFDLHCDTLTECQKHHASLWHNMFHVDVKRATALYDRWFQMMAVFVPDNMREDEAIIYVDDCLAFLQEEQKKMAASISRGYPTASTAKYALIPALENGKGIGDDIGRLAVYKEKGLAYITLTWNGTNRLGNGCLSQDDRGLTAFGLDAVQELFRLGIVPDVSHLNENGFWDVTRVACGRPFAATHSLSRAICDHPRNLTDAQFCAVRDSGGIVGMHLCASHLGEQSFERFETHLAHFLSLSGEKTVCIGMDLDGTDMPAEWGGIAVAEMLYHYLQSKMYPKSVLDAIFFENSYNFFRENFDNRARMR